MSLKIIGKGSGGKIIELESNKVVKVINEDGVKNFLEPFILLYLENINIMSASKIFLESNKLFKIVQNKAIDDLYNYVYNNEISSNLKKDFMIQLINGIDYLHSYGILHCDLKLNNILIFNDNIIKITDFGLSRFNNIECDNVKSLYTINFKAPEIINNEFVSYKTDIYALGCCFYEIFYRSSYFKILGGRDKVRNYSPKFKNKIFNNLIKNMVNNNYNERYSLESVKKDIFFETIIFNNYKKKILSKDDHITHINKIIYRYNIKDNEAFLNKCFTINKFNKELVEEFDLVNNEKLAFLKYIL